MKYRARKFHMEKIPTVKFITVELPIAEFPVVKW